MKTYWPIAGTLVLGWIATSAGCSTDNGSGVDDQMTSGATTTSQTTTAVSTASGGSSAGTTAGTTTTGETGFDLTTGATGTTGDTGVDHGENGGLVPLTSEQIATIKSGECSGLTAEAEAIPPVVQLVVDVSQSMGTAAPGEPMVGGNSRWDLARPALLAALDALPAQIAVGLQLFPTSDPPGSPGTPAGGVQEECVGEAGRVPIAPLGDAGSAHRQALATAMNQTALYYGTPTHDAYHNALEDGLKQWTGPGDKFMLLVTDGAPTQLIGCGELGMSQMAVGLEPILAEVTATAADGIRTFVIGSPGSEEGAAGDMRSFLSEMAQVGGTGPMGCLNDGPNYCHFDMTQSTDFSTALAEGLAEIADQVASTCNFAAPEDDSTDLSEVSVILEKSDGSASLVIVDADGDCATEGWFWNSAGEIELCPQSCELVKADPGSSVSVSLGCDDLIR